MSTRPAALCKFVFSVLAVLAGYAAGADAALAQDAGAPGPKTVLVLDGSGSMWGQIEGEAKITIAQQVIGDLLDTLPDDQVLGLTVYGHRRKGDCNDIESLVAPGAGTREAIRSAVNAIKPKGKTPLSAAVLAAAEELKYEEDVATVILVSDGRETCEFDPCALGTRLEETGVDFTAHVIGFDVADAEERAQLQCLADNTGGRFLTASNAKELSVALKDVSVPEPKPAPEPEPAAIGMKFDAIAGEGGETIRRDLTWTLAGASGEVVVDGFAVADLAIALEPGGYQVSVVRGDDGATAERTVTVAPGGEQHVTLVIASALPEATIAAPATAVAGATVTLQWTGPDADNDYIAVTERDAPGGDTVNYTYTREGSPLTLVMPPQPGTFEVRYILSNGQQILAAEPIEITEVAATITAPSTADAGATVAVQWTGPDYANDYIAVARTDDPGSGYVNYTYTRQGSPLQLVMPAEPGEYEIRYLMNQSQRVLARQTVTVGVVQASLEAPATAAAGSTVDVAWTGPGYDRDYIAVAKPDAPASRYERYTYTREGTPLGLEMPTEPGTYEIRYILNQDQTVLASRQITVETVTASVAAPAEATVGSTVDVEWTGPDYDLDYLSVAKAGDGGGDYVNYVYTRHGSPAKLLMPPEPGDYEIRYILRRDAKVLASQPIRISPAEASVGAPSTAVAGSTVAVQWQGPDAQNDYISVAEPDEAGGRYVHYAYTRHGSPLQLEMPPTPGSYEIRYILNQGGNVLARQLIEITDVSASLTVPPGAGAGETISVEWTGPDYKQDYIAIARPGEPSNRYEHYAYTRRGSPLDLKMPDASGSYEIRYIMRNGNRLLASETIEIE